MSLSHRHELMPLPGSPISGVAGDVAITTTTNTVYEMMKLGGQEGEYELVSVPQVTSLPPAKDLEVAYEIPSLPPSHQPLPAIPLSVATPPSEKMCVVQEEGVYECILGDQ